MGIVVAFRVSVWHAHKPHVCLCTYTYRHTHMPHIYELTTAARIHICEHVRLIAYTCIFVNMCVHIHIDAYQIHMHVSYTSYPPYHSFTARTAPEPEPQKKKAKRKPLPEPVKLTNKKKDEFRCGVLGLSCRTFPSHIWSWVRDKLVLAGVG